MEAKKIKSIIIYSLVIILLSCINQKNTRNFTVFKNIDRQVILDSIKGYNIPFKYYTDHNQFYLINQNDSSFFCDIHNLLFYKEYYSKYILVFYSTLDSKDYIAVLQNNHLNTYPCNHLIGFRTKQNSEMFQIEVKDSLIEFGTLGYGIHQLKLLNNDTIPKYKYIDFGPQKL